MGPMLEQAAARQGWMLTNDPDGCSILVAIDAPDDHEARLADDDEAAEVFRRALDARQPCALAALAELLAWGPGPAYLLDLLGGELESPTYVRAFSQITVDGREPSQAAGRLAMVGPQPLAGTPCTLLGQREGQWQVIVEPGDGDLIAANQARGAMLIRWGQPALGHSAAPSPWGTELQPSFVVLVPVISLDTSVSAAMIRDALRKAGVHVGSFRVDQTGGNVATITVGSIEIGPGLYEQADPASSTFDFDQFILVGPADSDKATPVASMDDLVAAARPFEWPHRPQMRGTGARQQAVDPGVIL